MVKRLKSLGEQVNVLCYDCRGHGKSYAQNNADFQQPENLSLNQLSDDCLAILNWKKGSTDSTQKYDIILVGHSMGGAVVVDSSRRVSKSFDTLLGVVMVDVVEGWWWRNDLFSIIVLLWFHLCSCQ